MRIRIPTDDEMISTTHFVYDQETGEIVYSQKLTTLRGTETRQARKTKAALLKEAGSASGKAARRLAVITLSDSDKIEGAIHKVDVAKKKLVIVKRGKTLPLP